MPRSGAPVTRHALAAILLVLAVDVGSSRAGSGRAGSGEQMLPEYIGTAEMAADGTLTLRLIAYGRDGSIGHSMLTYRPDDRDYRDILAHIGPMQPGQQKPVRPWPDPPNSEKP